MKLPLNSKERIYLFNILERLAFRSGEVNGRKARRKVQSIAQQLDPNREPDPDLSRKELESLKILLNGYKVVANSVKQNPNTESSKLDFIKDSIEIIESAQEKVDEKLKAN